MRRSLLLLLLIAIGFGGILADEPDKEGLIKRVIHYFETSNKVPLTRRPSFSFIGGPHYSSDTGIGVGLVVAGNYSTAPTDTTVLPSNVSIFADLTTGGFYKVGVEGIHNYDLGNRRINYELSFESYSTYFWGIGYEQGSDDTNKGKYLLLNAMIEGDHLWRLARALYAGPLARINYLAASRRKDPEQWVGLPLHYPVVGAGLRLEWDTRDNFTAPTTGWFINVAQRFSPRFLGNTSHSFSSTEFAISHYSTVWKGGVMSGRVHGHFSYGNTPWGMMPTLGGSRNMRGYYEGQYRDKCESDITLELRQHVWRRSGIALWGGTGAVYPHIKKIARHLLPNYGIGYRWEFRHLSNLRIDVGFGKKCWGFVLNMNEAF